MKTTGVRTNYLTVQATAVRGNNLQSYMTILTCRDLHQPAVQHRQHHHVHTTALPADLLLSGIQLHCQLTNGLLTLGYQRLILACANQGV